MQNIARRNLLYAFGVVSVTPLSLSHAVTALSRTAQNSGAKTASSAPTSSRGAAVAKPGENRYAFKAEKVARRIHCKVTSSDSRGSCSIFELGALPHYGPPRHVHHREEERYYVLSGDLLFEAGGQQSHLPTGGSIWLPRDLSHCWANEGTTTGKLILMCQPAGFEKFFDEAAQLPLYSQDPAELEKLHELHAKYGMELVGPPIFPTV
jgi:mannose-6-phosphate isomerase-like protein (cupin superfamily)